jgi:predicted DCC family thiol-disulfide oxidoreductase YuxK
MSAIVLFDGVCNFCNGTVNFIIARDDAGYFKFAPMQSEIGQELRAKCGVSDEVDSIILIEDDTAYIYSSAALRIARRLGGMWPAVYGLMIIPKPIRDFFYKVFARNRYRLFGKKDVCMVPTPEVRERFL